MDARYARGSARRYLERSRAEPLALSQMLSSEIGGWLRGNAGMSRQYGVPVSELICPRLTVTGAFCCDRCCWPGCLPSRSLISSAGRNPSLLWQAPATFLLAVPTAAMATICLLTDSGGPVLVMTLLLAARDFKFLDRISAQGMARCRICCRRGLRASDGAAAVSRTFCRRLLRNSGLATAFDCDRAQRACARWKSSSMCTDLGQLAWNAAMNRDLPVLLAVTLVMALGGHASREWLLARRRHAEWNSV